MPGFGRFAADAALRGDVPVVQGTLVVAIVFVLAFNVVVNVVLVRLRPAAQRGVLTCCAPRSALTGSAPSRSRFSALIVLLAVFGPLLAPHDPLAQDASALLQGPSGAHWLGTDDLGRDVLSRLLAGSTLSLVAALEAVVVGLVLGVVPGSCRCTSGRRSSGSRCG